MKSNIGTLGFVAVLVIGLFVIGVGFSVFAQPGTVSQDGVGLSPPKKGELSPPEDGKLSPPKGGKLSPPKGGKLSPPKGGKLSPPKGGKLSPPEGGQLSSPNGGDLTKAGHAAKAPLPLELPKPAFKGTPKHVPPGTNLEKPRKGPRPPFLAPRGTKLISRGKSVLASDDDPIIGEAELVTDGDAEANEGGYVEFGPGLQHVQIDLGRTQVISAVVLWHYHLNARVYHDVIVQVSDDEDFISGVKTLFNNDHDNSAGLGLGSDKEYWEVHEGKLVDAKETKARFVRLYSAGSTEDDQNHYTEVAVYGRPAQ